MKGLLRPVNAHGFDTYYDVDPIFTSHRLAPRKNFADMP